MINVYSKSEHPLGRLLSNFAHTPFMGDNGMRFESVEGWWYWYTTGKIHPELAKLYGFRAKQEGKKYSQTKVVTHEILAQVYRAKLRDNPEILTQLLAYSGEFEHYYVFNGNKVPATKWLWTARLWEKIRDEYKTML